MPYLTWTNGSPLFCGIREIKSYEEIVPFICEFSSDAVFLTKNYSDLFFYQFLLVGIQAKTDNEGVISSWQICLIAVEPEAPAGKVLNENVKGSFRTRRMTLTWYVNRFAEVVTEIDETRKPMPTLALGGELFLRARDQGGLDGFGISTGWADDGDFAVVGYVKFYPFEWSGGRVISHIVAIR